MKDSDKTKEELINEAAALRHSTKSIKEYPPGAAYPLSTPDLCDRSPEIDDDSPVSADGSSPTDMTVALRELKREALERRQIEEALRQSEEEYRSLIDNLNIGIYRNTGGGQGQFIKANPAIAAIFGYDSVDELIEVPVADLYMYPEDRQRFVDEVIVNGYVKGKELLLKKKDGTPIWAACTASVKYDGKGNIRWIDGIIEDITQRRQAEEALRENEFKFRSLFDLSPQAVALIDFKTAAIIEVNDKFCDLFKFSREEIIGKSTTELGFYSEEQRAVFLHHLQKSGEVHGLAMDFTPKYGAKINAQMYSKFIQMKGDTFILTILLNVTEQKKLEAQFQQAQRIEAIGTLAGGIAHDFNNLLMAIQGNVSLLRMQFDDIEALSERLKAIEEYIHNGSELTRQLLGFARGGKYEIKPADLNDLILKSSTMFGRTKKEITIHHDLEKDLWTVEIDRGQIEQVILNLLVNAWQAMEGGGDLFLVTKNVILDHTFVRPFEIKSGKYVKLLVIDTGTGMSNEILQRIFDPFFTTKEMSRGTGLGLASAYGIIKNHGGIIEARSDKGKGAIFEVYLPATDREISKINEQIEKIESPEALPGDETVLFVDDEEIIIEVADGMLKKLGYRVLIATGGKEAVDLFARNKDRVDIVVLDLIMPDMGGRRTYDRLKQIDPDVKVLLSSGYSVDSEAAAIIDRGGDGFIQKPFNAVHLTRKIRQILDKE